MQCPRCKKEIEENSLKCGFCNTKVGKFCPDCNTYNLINATECSACGKVLLKICTECGAANLADAISCRKCGIEFISDEEQADLLQPMYFANMNSQQKVKAKLLEK